MKGPNPFVLWDENPKEISGRKEEVRIFNSFANEAASKQGGGILVFGVPGTGKTTLLRHFGYLAEKSGILAPYTKVEKGESLEVTIDKLYNELRVIPGAKIGKTAPKTVKELIEVVEMGGKHFGTVFFIDDFDKMKKSNDAIIDIEKELKGFWGEKTAGFVLSSTREFKFSSSLVRKMKIGAFEEHEGHEVVEKALGKESPRMGDECFNSIMNDTQGNPLLFKTVCHHIYARLRDNEKVISKGHYLAYLPYIMSMLSREWFGKMYQETPGAEKEILLALAKNESMHVSDIANELGKPLGPVTALIKRLLDRGQIVKLDRGKYRIFAKLYGRYVIQRS